MDWASEQSPVLATMSVEHWPVLRTGFAAGRPACGCGVQLHIDFSEIPDLRAAANVYGMNVPPGGKRPTPTASPFSSR